MKCPFLKFETECVGAECPLYVSVSDMERWTGTTTQDPICSLRMMTRFLFAYPRDCAKVLTEMENLGKRVGRKLDKQGELIRHRF